MLTAEWCRAARRAMVSIALGAWLPGEFGPHPLAGHSQPRDPYLGVHAGASSPPRPAPTFYSHEIVTNVAVSRWELQRKMESPSLP